ncbi:hypothetical protein, partial [Thalassolituus sp. UBA6592]|uniref:hypothetical protein n=1 Tax=Thalassolituus sp. UBA6592 TaxID=1947665 RepID=UPI0025FC9ABA
PEINQNRQVRTQYVSIKRVVSYGKDVIAHVFPLWNNSSVTGGIVTRLCPESITEYSTRVSESRQQLA